MIKYDDSSLNVEKRGKLPLYEGLEDFAHQVSLAKPMINFVVDHKCVGNRFVKKDKFSDGQSKEFITGFVVYENGEELGAIGTEHRYRGGDKDLVYEVESFRIDKSRGSVNLKQSKDIKVALRIAKKMLVARAEDESKTLLIDTVKVNIATLHNSAWNAVRWTINTNDESFIYAMTAYKARLRGETSVPMPAKLHTVADFKTHDEACALAEDITHIKNLFSADRGYCVQVLANDSFIVYSLADKSIKKYSDFYDLPENIQGKYAMFKVLKVGEAVPTVGIKINGEFAYVVA